MYRRIGQTWTTSRRGQVVLSIWAATVAGATLKAVMSRRRRQAEKARLAASAGEEKQKKKSRRTKLRKLLKKAMSGKYKTMPWLALLSASIVAKVFVSVQVSRQIGHLGRLVATQDWNAMFRGQINFAIWCMPAAAVMALTTFTEARLALAFRSNLTDALHAEYETCQTMLPASRALDAPDQRLTIEVNQLCTQLSELYTGTFRPIIEVLMLSGTLASMMGVKELLTSYGAMFAMGTWIRWVGPSFKRFTTQVAENEATFRSSHKRIVDYAEEIHMLRGSGAEVGIARADFSRLRKVLSAFQTQSALADCLSTYTLRYLSILVAYATMLPAVYYGAPNAIATSGDDPTEYTLTCLHLLVNVGLAGRTLVQSMRKSATAGALAVRIDEVSEALSQPSSADSDMRSTTNSVVELTNVDLDSPDGTRLVTGLTFRIGANQHVFVHGPNGAGKTTLFRLMCGIVEPTAGHVATPPASNCFYVPQRPYLIPGSIRDQLLYPNTSTNASVDEKATSHDDHILSVLKMVGLQRLAATPEDLSLQVPWEGLSAGEKQRVGIARLLIHQPEFAMLDECTNNLNEAFEAWVYEHCRKLGITLFTVSHRMKLRKHHVYELELHGDETFTFQRIEDADES